MKPRRNLRASRNATLDKLSEWLDRELHKVRRRPSNADAIHDARVAARLVGPKGRLVGLEASLPLAMLAAEGLRREPEEPRSARIEVYRADCRTYLGALPSGSFDVVLFDPMFSRERRAQPSFALLRRLASPTRLDASTLAAARRARRRRIPQMRSAMARRSLAPI